MRMEMEMEAVMGSWRIERRNQKKSTTVTDLQTARVKPSSKYGINLCCILNVANINSASLGRHISSQFLWNENDNLSRTSTKHVTTSMPETG